MALVAKVFKTVNRKFAVGAEVTADDLVDDVMSVEDRKSQGFIKDPPAPRAAPVSRFEAKPADDKE